MDTSTQELVYQAASIGITTIFSIVGIYAKRWLSTNATLAEYGLYNDKVERVLENAVSYAEEKSKALVGEEIKKKDLALKYVEMVSPDVIEKEGDKLEAMIDRKVHQVLR